MKDHEIDITLINNFEIVSNSTRNQFNNGGTLIASSNSNLYKINERKDLQVFNTDKNFESSAVQISVSRRLTFVLMCIYRSPSGSFDEFFEKLDACLSIICRTECKKYIVVGISMLITFRIITKRKN